MNGKRRNRKGRSEKRGGFALVVILAFVVLLTVLVLAYFSYSSLQRQISSSSSSQATVDLFAQGAINTIVTDFKQEIFAGSTNFFYGTNTVSIPLAASNAAPVRVGTSTNLPNLVKRSAGGLAFYAGGPARASGVSSTAPSQNGRSISVSRWNQALLLPKADTNATADFTPVASFAAPDWIYVDRGGNNPTGWSPALRWSGVPTDTNVVVGRYAYTVYDEGGLLDVNVAGYPPGTTNAIAGYKNPLSYADLTQVGLSTNAVAALVGWRNAASALPNGSFPNFTFNGAGQTNFFRTVSTNAAGFLKTANTNLVSGESDRMFVSRQHFLQFLQGLADAGVHGRAALQNCAQYLGTFSRALEQPSFMPNPARPNIVGTIAPPDVNQINTYQGNNTYLGGESVINLKTGGFLSVRVQSPGFTRLNGEAAVVGEPLVKTRFALSHLSKVTTSAVASASQSDPIYARFDLTRSSPSQPWVYNHGASTILTLSAVAARNREPDFAELLKAAINAGSVGKAGPSGQGNNYQYVMDASGDIQILQIMANLIDQVKTDNYPTRIQYSQTVGAQTRTRTIFGTQDLPYFYRWHYLTVATKLPSPLLASTDTVAVTLTATTGKVLNHVRLKGAATVESGTAAYLIVPQVWNPHDPNMPVASGGTPTTFRIVAETNDPTGTLGAWSIRAQPTAAGGRFDGADGWTPADPPASKYSAPNALTAANASLGFADGSGGRAFREPTLLWRNNFPAGVTLSGTSRTEDANLTGNTYYGILVGETPISWVKNIDTNLTDADTTGADYIFQTSALQKGNGVAGPSGSLTNNITFRLQYLDTSGNWITYQEVFAEDTLTNISAHTLFVNKADYAGNNRYANPLSNGVNASGPALTAPLGGPCDPRSGRFSTPITGRYDADDPGLNGNPTLDAVTKIANGNPTAAQNLAVAASNFVLMKTQRPATSRGQFYDYLTAPRSFGAFPNNAPMRFFSSASWTSAGNGMAPGDSNFHDGLFSQNNPAVRLLGNDNASLRSIYYEDPDGICRRAMGAYVPTAGSPTGRLTTTASKVGLPMVTSGSIFSGGIVTPDAQSQSRPIILHRPFRSVAEMSYAFRGTPWKNIDFFTPESGDSALLDVFCVEEPPADPLVAGRVYLNTRQAPVLSALFSSAYRDEFASLSAPPAGGVLPPLDGAESKALGETLVSITSGTEAWRGPLANLSDIVGRYITPNPPAVSGPDAYQYVSPAGNVTHTFSGFTAALSGTNIWNSTNAVATQNIQRFRESAIRPLVNGGQTRVWNLLIDVVAQSGRFSATADALDRFTVEGERRYWVHLAIDRATGAVVDRQVEMVSE